MYQFPFTINLKDGIFTFAKWQTARMISFLGHNESMNVLFAGSILAHLYNPLISVQW